MRAPIQARALVVASILLGAAAARATPADILVLVDTSGSMRKAHGAGTRLDAAKQLAAQVIKAAQDRHRVGLARFAQRDTIVQGGEGKRLAHAEDVKQCERASNLLAPVSPTGAAQALRWLDGVEALGNPELVALGDSPLARATEVAVAYLRGKRQGDPLRHCVNAYLVVITDGEDTCAGGDELRNRIAALAAQAQKEEIRALVLSYTPEAEAAKAIAKIGQSDPNVRPFGPDDGPKLVEAVKAIVGRLAPDACLASGVKPSQIGLGGTAGADAGSDAARCGAQGGESGCGCALAERPRRRAPLLLLALVAGIAGISRRRRPLLIAAFLLGGLALAGCGDGPAAGCPPRDAGPESGPPPGQLVEPAQRRDEALGRLPAILAAAEETRTTILAPLLVPEKVYAAQKDVEACVTLARSLGLELYQGAQRGPAGCLATRRCSSLDKALLLEACAKSKGASVEILTCNPSESFRAKLRAEALRAPALPDLAAVTAREKELVKKLYPDLPDAQSRLDGLLAARDQGLASFLATNVKKEVATLEPLAKLDATSTAQGVEARIEKALGDHYFVRLGGKLVDPSLAGSEAETGACNDFPAEVKLETLRMKVEVLVHYAGPSKANWIGEEVLAGELAILPHALFGETLSVGIADAAQAALPTGLPPAAASGCLRAFLEIGAEKVRGAPFPIGQADLPACGGAPLLSVGEGEHLARVVLRVTTRYGEVGESFVVERTLLDRYGYALSEAAAKSAGPMYSDETARELAPLRVDLPLVSGLLSPAAQLDARLRDLVARKPEIEAAAALQAGLPTPAPPPGPPRLFPLTVIGAVGRHAGPILGGDLTIAAERPWLIGHVRRRGFGVSGASLDIVEQSVLDVLDAPLLVFGPSGGDAATRLRAQLGLGALVTEAEAAVFAAGEKVPVTNAGRMLRDAKLTWSAMDPTALDPKLFPLSVREAAFQHKDEVLIVTTGAPGAKEDQPAIAWWRLDKATGRTLSEVRYDGTFYGGAAGVKLIIDIDKCLYVAAAEVLGGAESCDISPCIEKAWKDFAKNAAMDYLTGALGALGGALGCGESLIWGISEMTNEVLGNVNDLIEGMALPECK